MPNWLAIICAIGGLIVGVVLFNLSLVILSRLLNKLGHEWQVVTKQLDWEVPQGYSLVSAPIPCILYRNGDVIKAIRIFSRN